MLSISRSRMNTVSCNRMTFWPRRFLADTSKELLYLTKTFMVKISTYCIIPFHSSTYLRRWETKDLQLGPIARGCSSVKECRSSHSPGSSSIAGPFPRAAFLLSSGFHRNHYSITHLLTKTSFPIYCATYVKCSTSLLIIEAVAMILCLIVVPGHLMGYLYPWLRSIPHDWPFSHTFSV